MRNALTDFGLRGDVVDSYRYAASLFSKVVSDGYIGMVRTIPKLYGIIYDRAERAREAGGFRVWAGEFTARNIHGLIERMQPSAVVCTHAFPCGVMAAYKRMYDAASLPVMGVVTDFLVHPFWIYRNIDAYAVATPEMRATLIARGIDPARIAVDGIPIDPRFGDRSRTRAELREQLGLPGHRPVILVMGGGLGLGPVAATTRALASLDRDATTVVIVGKNRTLQSRVEEAARSSAADTRVLGFVENVDEYMRASDVLLTKPGGLTTSEALSAELPMILIKPLPGQEERNARYLAAKGAALRAESQGDVRRLVAQVLDDAAMRRDMGLAMAALRTPDSAHTIAQRIAAIARR